MNSRYFFLSSYFEILNVVSNVNECPPAERIPIRKFFCHRPWEHVMIDINGNVRICCHTAWEEGVLGNLFIDDFDAIWNNKKINSMRDTIARGILPNECRNCPICIPRPPLLQRDIKYSAKLKLLSKNINPPDNNKIIFTLDILNNGKASWQKNDSCPQRIRVGCRIYQTKRNATDNLYPVELRAELPKDIHRQGRFQCDFAIDKKCVAGGEYMLRFDMVYEHRFWFEDLDSQPLIEFLKMADKKLFIVIVTHNSERFIINCLNNLMANEYSKTSEIIVIDNDSKDKTKHLLDNYPGKIKKIYNSKNIGYARGCNQGFNESTSNFVLFMNPDAFPEKNVIQNLIEYMEHNPATGAASCCLLNHNRSIQYSFRKYPRPYFIFTRALEGCLKRSNDSLRKSYLMANVDHAVTRSVPWLTGAFLMVRDRAFRHISGFDEKYFLYCEDADLCLRLKKKGWKVAYVPEAGNVIHLYQHSSRQAKISFKTINHVVSLLRFFIKNGFYFSILILLYQGRLVPPF